MRPPSSHGVQIVRELTAAEKISKAYDTSLSLVFKGYLFKII